MIKYLRYSALLHDIGHLPFSHSSEELLKEEKKHEDLSAHIIKAHPVIQDVLEDEELNPDIINRIITGGNIHKYNILRRIISGEFDADRTDYLLRDSYNCGVEYGKFDYQRFIDSFALKDKGELITYIKKKNIHSVESLVVARYHYYTQVVFHRTRMGYDKIFKKYLEANFQNESKKLLGDELDLEWWTNFDDCYVLQKIKEDAVVEGPWAKYLLRKQHLKPLFSSGSHASPQEIYIIKKIQKRLKAKGFTRDEDFFVLNRRQEIHELNQRSDEGSERGGERDMDTAGEMHEHQVIDKNNNIIGNVTEISGLLAKFKVPIKIFRLYCVPESFSKMESIVNNVLEERYSIEDEKLK